jgi:hypothetical protein
MERGCHAHACRVHVLHDVQLRQNIDAKSVPFFRLQFFILLFLWDLKLDFQFEYR